MKEKRYNVKQKGIGFPIMSNATLEQAQAKLERAKASGQTGITTEPVK